MAVMNDAELARQARRLRFDDPATEARFQAHDDERSVRQWRIATALGAVVVIALGVLPAAGMKPWQEEIEAFGRFGLMLPWLFVALGFTWWRGQRHRMQLVGAVCVAASVSMYFLTQSAIAGTRSITANYVSGLIIAGSQYLVGVAVAVPLRTRALAAAAVPTVAVFVGGFMAMYPAVSAVPAIRDTIIQQSTVVFGIVLVLIAVTWARERLQRVSFAQRAQLEAMNAELARMNAEKNEFMAIAAHDLRAPLATVSGVAGQMKTRAADAKTEEGAALIEAQAGRMLALVNDYLGAHAAESGTLPVRRERLQLGEAAREAARRHGLAAARKRQTIEVGGAEAATWVEADAVLLAQVADNLVSNAIKFSPAGAAVRIEVQTAEGHPRARLAVIDRGPGIAADEQANLFRKFGRASSRPTGGETSHGLGLAVAKRLAEAMGGSVGCESQAGAGATFWVELGRS
jgi:signal transduction histidine kinase